MCSGECEYLVYFFFSTKFNIGFASFFFPFRTGNVAGVPSSIGFSLPIFLFLSLLAQLFFVAHFFFAAPTLPKYYLGFFICIGMRKKKFGFVNVQEVAIKIRICFLYPLRSFGGVECINSFESSVERERG